MEIIQKRMANHIRFDFGDEALRYSIRDNSGERDLKLDYAQIPKDARRVFERNTWLRNVGLMWCALGVLLLGLALAASKATIGSAFWLIIGALCLGFYKATQTNYKVLDTEAGTIWIIENAQEAEILKELRARRNARLLAMYGAFDPNNEPDRERRKFDWLVEQEVLSRAEADRLIASGRGEDAMLPAPDRLMH